MLNDKGSKIDRGTVNEKGTVVRNNGNASTRIRNASTKHDLRKAGKSQTGGRVRFDFSASVRANPLP